MDLKNEFCSQLLSERSDLQADIDLLKLKQERSAAATNKCNGMNPKSGSNLELAFWVVCLIILCFITFFGMRHNTSQRDDVDL
jgi:hypothetical protein